MTENQILSCKEYGKAKVYLINQDLFPETSQEQLNMLDEQIQVRKVEHDGLADTLKKSQAKLKEVLAIGETNDKIAERLAAVKADVEAL